MRTAVNLDPDVEAAVRRLRREHGLGLSAAANEIARRGIASRPRHAAYEHRTAPLGLKMDVTNIGDVLDLLDDE